jgi:hypothetical protein
MFELGTALNQRRNAANNINCEVTNSYKKQEMPCGSVCG